MLFEPDEHRVAYAAERGTTILAVGAEAERFEPSPWEYGFRAAGLIDLGRFDEAVRAIDEGLDQYPDSAFHYVRARLAAAHGDLEGAREHLGLAAEADSSVPERARKDPLLRTLED